MPWVKDGEQAGTTGQKRRMEALEVLVRGMPSTYHVHYSAHVKNTGWMAEVTDGATAGTTGQSRRLEAVKIRITTE